MNKYRIIVRHNKMKGVKSQQGRVFTQVFLEKFSKKQWNHVAGSSCMTADSGIREQFIDVALDCLKNGSVAVLNMKNGNPGISDLAQARVLCDIDPIIQCEVIEIKDKR